jgi:ribosomal protein S18 acetylase RimI-like enzyme
MSLSKENIKITDRNITKEELNKIYEDFKKIEKQDGIPDANTKRYEYIAEVNSEIIGIASGLTNHKWFYLTDLWVHEDHRRNALGTKLLSMLEDKLRSIGIKHIYTWTSGFINPKFYEKQGYKVFTIFEDFYEVNSYHQIGYRKDL